MRKHAAERVYQRVLGIQEFDSNMVEICKFVISHKLRNRVLPIVKTYNTSTIIRYKNVDFVFNNELNAIITAWANNSRDNFQLRYVLPDETRFNSEIPKTRISKRLLIDLITQGMVPKLKEKSMLIGYINDYEVSYDLSSKRIYSFRKVRSTN